MATKTYKIKVGMSNAEKQAVADNIINKIISGEIPVQDARQIIFDNINVSLSGETVQAIIEEICDILDMKANKDGYYSQLHSGLSDNLASPDGVINEEPYVFRPTAGTTSVADGYATIKKLKGNTIVWNQLSKPYTTDKSKTTNGIELIDNRDGSYILNGTATAETYIQLGEDVISTIGHKYLILGGNGGSSSTYYLTQNSSSGGNDYGYGAIYTQPNNTYARFMVVVIKNGTTLDNLVFRPQLFDLTLMFGAGNEPTSVEEFKALFPNSYYEYNEGELIHARPLGIKTVGFNAFDGELAQGYWNVNNGEATLTSHEKYFTCSNLIRVVGGQQYTLTNNTTNHTNILVGFLDNDKLIIDSVKYIPTDKPTQTIIAPSNAVYFFFEFYNANGITIPTNAQIAFHLTHSGYRNGEYEEHWSETREINTLTYFPSGMKSAGSVYDELTPTKAIKRIGLVNLGTLNWQINSEGYFSNMGAFPHKDAINNATKANITCSKYQTITANERHTVIGIFSANANYFVISDTSFTDATEFKNSLNGVMLAYELETPVETDIEQTRDANWDYRISDFGTEEYITNSIAPVAHETFYMANLRDEVRNLPKNYISKASFDNFTSALSSALGISISATYNETTKSYDFSIVKSVEE